jgi:hypothetical protein
MTEQEKDEAIKEAKKEDQILLKNTQEFIKKVKEWKPPKKEVLENWEKGCKKVLFGIKKPVL